MCRGYSSIKEYILWAILMSCPLCRWIARKAYPQWRQWLVVLLMLPLLAGCATAWKVAENPAFQTAVQYAVSEYVFKSETKQSEALKIVQKLQAHVDESKVVTVAELKNMTMESIPWDALTFQERLELRGMVEAIAQHLQQKVGTGELEKDDQVEVKEFLAWIENAIHFAGK